MGRMYKRRLSRSLIPILVFGLTAFSWSLVEAQISVALICGESPTPEDPVQVTVMAVLPEDLLLGAFEATVSWSPALLEFVSIEEGDYGALNTNISAIPSGRITFNAFNTAGRSGDFPLAVLSFKSLEGGDAIVEISLAETVAAQTFADLLSQVTVAPCTISHSDNSVGNGEPLEEISVLFEGPSKVAPGTSIEVSLFAAVPTDLALGAFGVALSWDPEVLRFLSIEEGTYGALNSNTSASSSGRIAFNAFDTSGKNGEVVLGVLSFEVVGSEGTSTTLELELGEFVAAQTFEDLLSRIDLTSHTISTEIESMDSSPISIDFDLAPGDQEERRAYNAVSGKVYEMQLNVDDAPEINGWSVTIEYDPEQVSYVSDSFQASDFLPGLFTLPLEKEASIGIGGALLSSDVTNIGDAVLGTLSFEILEGFTGSADLAITEISFSRTDKVEDIRIVRSVATLTSERLESACLGDVDDNGTVDFQDFFIFSDHFGTDENSPDWDPISDLDSDGSVDFRDFFILADRFGGECSNN